jgi:hypothetical protein
MRKERARVKIIFARKRAISQALVPGEIDTHTTRVVNSPMIPTLEPGKEEKHVLQRAKDDTTCQGEGQAASGIRTLRNYNRLGLRVALSIRLCGMWYNLRLILTTMG